MSPCTDHCFLFLFKVTKPIVREGAYYGPYEPHETFDRFYCQKCLKFEDVKVDY